MNEKDIENIKINNHQAAANVTPGMDAAAKNLQASAPKELTPEQMEFIKKKVSEDPDFARAYGFIKDAFDLSVLPDNQGANQPQKVAATLSKERSEEIHKLLRDDKKFAKAFHTLCNFIGLHLVGNSALSLFITYNIAPLKQTQQLIHGLAKVIEPAISLWDKAIQAVGFKGTSHLSKELRAHQITQLSRSHTETAVMCIAGSIILLGVMPWENSRSRFVNWFDELIHPGKKAKVEAAREEARQHGLDIPPPEPEHKETLGNLLKVRALALVPIFAINGQIESFNNARSAKNLGNLDTFIWDKGAKIYDNTSPSVRDRFINFFSRKGHDVKSIQPLVREALEKTVGTNPSRMIAAEQFRMFSKEIYLTAIYTGFLYALGKTPIIPWTLKKLGFSKKEEQHLETAIEEDIGLDVLPQNNKRMEAKLPDAPVAKPTATSSRAENLKQEPPLLVDAQAASEKEAHQKGFAANIQPKTMSKMESHELYTEKLAAKKMQEDAKRDLSYV